MKDRGLIQVYYGYGKGKTTAAFGLALRALGHGQAVIVVQFLKSKPSGEVYALRAFERARVLRGSGCDKFASAMSEEERKATKQIHDSNLAEAIRAAEHCDLLILDEVIDAYQLGLLDEAMLKRLIYHKPKKLELVLTGHREETWIAEAADYITEMKKEKHPFDKGITAREGVEY